MEEIFHKNHSQSPRLRDDEEKPLQSCESFEISYTGCEMPIRKKEFLPWRKRSINEFKILKKLGQGGYGCVFLASKRSS